MRSLAEKKRLLDEYARRSDLADSSPDAVDVSEVELARRIVLREQERLALEPSTQIRTVSEDSAES